MPELRELVPAYVWAQSAYAPGGACQACRTLVAASVLGYTSHMSQDAPLPTKSTHEEASREKFRVALASLAAAIVLTLSKLGIGLWTQSLGILAEAAHSGLDLLAAAVTLWAVRMASRPADRNQTYGYGKFENLSALIRNAPPAGHLRVDHARGLAAACDPACVSRSRTIPLSGRFS